MKSFYIAVTVMLLSAPSVFGQTNSPQDSVRLNEWQVSAKECAAKVVFRYAGPNEDKTGFYFTMSMKSDYWLVPHAIATFEVLVENVSQKIMLALPEGFDFPANVHGVWADMYGPTERDVCGTIFGDNLFELDDEERGE